MLSVALLLSAAPPGFRNVDFSEATAHWTPWPEDLDVKVAPSEAGPVLQVTVGEDSPVDWQRASQSLPVTPGTRIAVAVWGRAVNPEDGHGVFCSLNFVDAEEKRVATGYAIIPPGVVGWTPMRAYGEAPDDAVRVDLLLGLHGRGEAHFRGLFVSVTSRPQDPPLADGVVLEVTGEQTCQVTGFGAEDDGWFYNEDNRSYGADDAAYALREARLAWMRPHYIRMFFWYRDWNPSVDAETFTWDSDNMRSHYRSLDVYQRLGTRVNVTGVEWAVKDPWGDPERLARAVGALLEHLIVEKGYTCVKDWTLTNEPNLFFAKTGQTFETFVKIHQLVKQEIVRRKLDVTIVGSDDGHGYDWFHRCVEDPDYFEAVGLFASHFYLTQSELPMQREIYRDRTSLLRKHDPVKPFIVGEFGVQDERFKPPATNPYMREYPYAIQSQWCFIEGLNAGVGGFLMWCLQECYYPGATSTMEFGLWNFGGDWAVRPVYHVVAAFCREAAPGDDVYRCASSHPGSVLASVAGDTLFWVNQSKETASLRVRGFAPGAVRIMTEATIEGDRECGTVISAGEDGRFEVPPESFGYAKRR